jgi:hypothetical protein
MAWVQNFPETTPSISWIGRDWMGHRGDLDALEKRKISCLCCILKYDFTILAVSSQLTATSCIHHKLNSIALMFILNLMKIFIDISWKRRYKICGELVTCGEHIKNK